MFGEHVLQPFHLAEHLGDAEFAVFPLTVRAAAFLLSLLFTANVLLGDFSLAAFPVLDHDADHLRKAGDLRQGTTRSCLTLGGCARVLHSLVCSSGSGCHTG